ncbi:sensor histidine kinase [Rosistilla carotiformis]|uniref:sensor histidine kinase n=1 Tax=Rosistilla carotiformis TaxID=2528017 RepID=UPI001E2DF2BD|nr:HAMP domain-containing sensor histidine kinase [Rosistilla carotiformis]
MTFRSLRIRLLAPLVLCSLLAAVAVAAVSYGLAQRWATRDLQARWVGIQRTLSESTFPLNLVVLRLLADLTQSELVTLDSSGAVLQRTVDAPVERIAEFAAELPISDRAGEAATVPTLKLSDSRYVAYRFPTRNPAQRSDRVESVLILFDEALLRDARRRAAILPLATGLSTIVALASITLIVTERMVRRITSLQGRVERVAAGDFESKVSDNVGDELGRLGAAVETMANQLKQLWATVHHQEGEKLLHQIAGGLAHQLRNSLTGARMAIELHANDCREDADEGLQVAIGQIEQAEDYVRRLLLVASGRQAEDRPLDALTCLCDVRDSLSPIARHLNVDLQWDLDAGIDGHRIKDGASLSSAISNLVLNAIQTGDSVRVEARIRNQQWVQVAVIDNGPGVAEALVDDLFKPFVTSRPEGLGLGLPVVARAAEHLDGHVVWLRRSQQTVFDFYARIVS